MQRVALCISGHFREFEIAWPYLKRNLIDVCQPDVFAFAWSDSFGRHLHKHDKTHASHTLGYDPLSPPVPDHYIDSVCRRLNPRRFAVRDSLDFYPLFDQLIEDNRDVEPTGWDWHRPRAKFQMLYARQEVCRLKQAHEQSCGFVYDRVIYTRWDIVHEEQIPSWAFYDPRVLMPYRYAYLGPSDIWAAGNSRDMDIWCSLLEHLPEIKTREGFTTHQHLWIKDQLNHFGIDYLLTGIPVQIANRPF